MSKLKSYGSSFDPSTGQLYDGAFKPVFYRSANNYDMSAASDESGLACLDDSLTKQSDKEDADMNVILERFARSGSDISALGGNLNSRPQYGDFTQITDYHSSLLTVVRGQQMFAELPAQLRARFNNSPEDLLDFLADPVNRAEAEKLGLVNSLPSGEPPVHTKAVGAPEGKASEKPSENAS